MDDANELTGLHLVLELLSRTDKHIRKIILTVRNYAMEQVLNKVYEFDKPEVLRIGLLKDEEIKALIKNTYSINDFAYLRRIADIAQGNARLAMPAEKVAAETGQLESIQDAAVLYEHYYARQFGAITCSETGIVSAGILAFFQALRLDNLGL